MGWRLTDLRLALRPDTVSPTVAGLHQAGLPLLHLGWTRPPIALGSLDHCSPPPQLACKTADKKKKKMSYLFMRTLTGMLKFDLSMHLSLVRFLKFLTFCLLNLNLNFFTCVKSKFVENCKSIQQVTCSLRKI